LADGGGEGHGVGHRGLLPYQMRRREEGSGQRPSPGWTAKASWKASRFLTTALQRYSSGECGSTTRRRDSSASLVLPRQTRAQLMKNRCAPVSPPRTGGGAPASESR